MVTAAGLVAFGPLADTPDDVLERIIAVDLLGPLRVMQGAIPHLPASERGGFMDRDPASPRIVVDTPEARQAHRAMVESTSRPSAAADEPRVHHRAGPRGPAPLCPVR